MVNNDSLANTRSSPSSQKMGERIQRCAVTCMKSIVT